MERETLFDTSRPFLAIVPNSAEGDYFDQTNAVYLVNPLELELTNVAIRTGGFFSDEYGVYEATPVDRESMSVPAHRAKVIEMTSGDEFDEFVCWCTISYDVGAERKTIAFNAGKRKSETQWLDNLPVLDAGGRVVSRGG